jgi:hypothetical protein
MATGANIQPGRGIVTTDLPPQVDMRDGSAEAWDAARRVADRFAEAGKRDLVRRAQARGAEEGAAVAAGEMEMPKRGWLFGGDVAEARTAALETAFTARIRTDIDAREAELRREHRYDPQAYERASAEMVSGFIQGAPPDFAVDVETYAKSISQRGLESVANNRSARDEQEVVQSFGVRRTALQERMIALASQPGGITDNPEYEAAAAEYAALQDEAEGNPAVLYSTDQRLADDERTQVGIQTAIIGAEAVSTYSASGRGLPGMAAATRQLREDILESETFAGYTPEARQRLYRDSYAQLNQYAMADREERRAEQEVERQRREAARDRRESYALRIAMGDGVGQDEILNDPDLDDGDRATLIRSADAAVRREAEQARRDANLEAQASRDIYNGYRDEANAGTLSEADLADAVNAGTLSRGQARTLATLRDRGLAPVVADVMAPVRDMVSGEANRARRTGANMAIAEEAAAIFARANPDATLEQRLAAGRAIGERVFGRSTTAAPSERVRQLAGLEAERTRRASGGNRMSQAEYNRRRNEIINGG